MKTTMNHVLTEEQAERIGFHYLAGEIVQVEMYGEGEKPAIQRDVPIAKNVYFGGKRIAGILQLDE